MTRLDLHAHVIADDYRARLRRALGGEPPLPPASLDALQAMMDRYRIDAAVISTGPPGADVGDQAHATELARVANESLAGIVARDPSRFAALAVVPLPDLDAACDELAHALDQLELDGVFLLTNVAGTYLGDAAWEPLYAELDRRGAYVFVHPTVPPYPMPPGDGYPAWLLEFPFETTRALAHLIFTGVIERYPGIRFQFSHLGGATPFLARRLASLAAREPQRAAAATAGVAEYLTRQYYDTGLSQDVAMIEATRAVAPLDHIVFGTDWPYAALPDGDDPAPELQTLAAEDRRAIDHRNGAALVPRLFAAQTEG